MKKFQIYKNIRKRAMIWGLPISLFAMMMISIIGSLLFIIFSFSFLVIISVFVFNAILYVALSRMIKNPALLHFRKVFPQTISNKKQSNLIYEEN
jgi:type IV secretory pathway VirB3-like protein